MNTRLYFNRIVRRSKFEWVIVRPVILTDGPKTNAYRDIDRTEIGPQPRPPDGISTGRQIEYATVEEEYAARMTFVQKAPAVRISRGVFPVQHLHACVNALTS
jgi:hypothetical protein